MSIDYAVRDGIAYITFCRPDKHNALRNEDVADLVWALGQFDTNDEALVAILSGQGRSFSSGADMADRLHSTLQSGNTADWVNERGALLQCDNWKPVIAAVHGYCLGHAVGTALSCDLLVAARDATFQLVEATLGIPPFRMWGPIAASHLMFANGVALTGRRFSAEEAWSAGMLTALAEPGDHIAVAEDLAHQIMRNPQWGVREQVRIRRNMTAVQEVQLQSIAGNTTRTWAQSIAAKELVAERVARSGKQG